MDWGAMVTLFSAHAHVATRACVYSSRHGLPPPPVDDHVPGCLEPKLDV